jgi:hypothetical protein
MPPWVASSSCRGCGSSTIPGSSTTPLRRRRHSLRCAPATPALYGLTPLRCIPRAWGPNTWDRLSCGTAAGHSSARRDGATNSWLSLMAAIPSSTARLGAQTSSSQIQHRMRFFTGVRWWNVSPLSTNNLASALAHAMATGALLSGCGINGPDSESTNSPKVAPGSAQRPPSCQPAQWTSASVDAKIQYAQWLCTESETLGSLEILGSLGSKRRVRWAYRYRLTSDLEGRLGTGTARVAN